MAGDCPFRSSSTSPTRARRSRARRASSTSDRAAPSPVSTPISGSRVVRGPSSRSPMRSPARAPSPTRRRRALSRLQQELAAAKPALVLAGTRGPDALEVAQAVAAINQASGANGTTIRPAESSPAFDSVARTADVLDAVEKMRGGLVPIVFVRGVNPGYALPASARFADAFAKVPFKVSFSMYPDETTELCDLIL